jgi:hypothetical protein
MTVAFQRFAGWCAVLTALAGVAFTVTFAIAVQEEERWALWASAVALTVGGIVAVPVLIALYEQVREPERQFALVALVLGLAGAVGAAIHGAFDIGTLSKPPKSSYDFPNAVDPRGFLTFAVTGVALALFGWLILRGAPLPRLIGQLAVAAAVLLLILYFGRLIILDPKAYIIRVAALASGLVVSPAFYLAFGRSLWQSRA